MPSYKLYYFHARVVVEAIRQLFAVAGVECEYIVIPKDEWPGEYKSKFPFGQVPVLEVDGQFLAQSMTIVRYLSKQFGLVPKDDFAAACVEAIGDQFKDYYAEFARWYDVQIGYREGDKDATKKEFGEPSRDKFFPLLVAELKKSDSSGFLVGNSLSFIDLIIAEHVATLQELFPGFLDAYPEVLPHSEKVRSIPAVKAWIEKRNM